MDFVNDRSWSCYPQGLMATRRAFLQTFATAAAASALPQTARAQDATISDEPIPGFPPGGFPEGSTRLDFNENPLGPSPKVLEALSVNGLVESHRYNYIDPIIDAIAAHHGVPSKNVLIGCGSTEFLQFVPWAVLKDGGNIVLPTPTYGWSAGVAESMGREAVRVPLGPLGRVDVAGLKKAMTAETRILYIANPNNPTGAALDQDAVQKLVEALPPGAIFLVDEAYHDFLPDGKSALDFVRRDAPVLVLRTYSKAFGLAGLRLGYAIGSDAVIEKVKSVWWGDFGINSAACIAGPVALADQDHVNRYIVTVDEGLDQLRTGLKALGGEPFPHRAPFFMVDMKQRARPIVRQLIEKKIFVRDGSAWGMPGFMRVSVGTATDNEIFLKALKSLV